MTRDRLEQLNMIKAEIKAIKKSLADANVVTDTVVGSHPEHPWTSHPIKIEGMGFNAQTRLIKRLNQKLEELQDELLYLENFLDTVPDNKMRTILRLKFRNGLTDREIGEEVGYSRQRIGQLISEFLKKL